MKKNNTILIIDVDGVMTNGSFGYTDKKKFIKFFSADDNDALKILDDYVEKIIFVTGDKRGFDISRKRIKQDMGFEINLVSTIKRVEWIKKKFKQKKIIYMGDGIFDPIVFEFVDYSISVANALPQVKKYAHYVTKRSGGDRAVAEAIIHILKKIYKINNYLNIIKKNKKFSGSWCA